MEVILFPDAALLVRNYLADELADRGDDTAVVTVVPNPRPDRLVLVRRVGGPRLNLVTDDPAIAGESWAPSAAEAHDRAQLCRALVLALVGEQLDGVAIYRVAELAGPADLPDPLSTQPRYVFSAQVAMRGAPESVGS